MSNKKNIFTRGTSVAVASAIALAMGISLHAQTATSTTATPPADKKTIISGFFKADYVYSNAAVMSYGTEALVGETHAKRQTQSDDKNARWGITPNQSRLTVSHQFSDKVKGVVETDLNGAGATSAGTAGSLRIRQAYISYTPNSKMEIFGGQTWDVFSPLNPHTYNATVALFQGGNISFVRNQFGMGYKIAENMIFKAAIGSPSGTSSTGTTGPSIGSEMNSTPTFAASFQFNPMKNLKLYFSGITVDQKVRQPMIDGKRDGLFIAYDVNRSCAPNTAGTVANTSGTNYPDNIYGDPKCGTNTQTFAQSWSLGHEKTQRMKAGGYSFGMDFDPTEKLNIKMEYNQGQNLASIGALGISSYTTTTYGSHFSQNYPSIAVNGSNKDILGKMYSNDVRPRYDAIKEQSAWMSWNMKVSPTIEVGTHHGVAKILNPKDLNADANVYAFATSSTVTDTGVGKIRENQVHGIRTAYKPADAGGLTLFAQVDYHRTIYATRKSESGWMDWTKTITLNEGVVTGTARYAAAPTTTATSPYILDAWSFHKASAEARATTVRMGMMLPF